MWRVMTAALLIGGSVVPASPAADEGRVLTFRDPRITESSGLVDLGSLMVTTNDSGNPSELFVVSAATGNTVGVTDFHADTVDVEALAPAGGSTVWVGDIGDNRGDRKSIAVYRVTVGPGQIDAHPAKYRLVYPRGAHDAESLFVDRQGRLYVITKSFLGGTVYRAPLPLGPNRPNRMQPVGRVIEYATDAAMLPDGHHVLVRGLGRASVYAFPGFKRLGSFVLPRQPQGEGVSVGPGSRIRLSSEGVRSVVRQMAIPDDVAQGMRPTSPSTTPSTTPSPSPPVSPTPRGTASRPFDKVAKPEDAGIQDDRWLMWSIPGAIVLGAVGIAFGLRRRSE